MSLLAHSDFEILFTGLAGKKIGFLPLDGNAGDLMIQQATRELIDAFAIKYREITNGELESGVLKKPVDEIVISGGGNMGTLWKKPYQQRRKSLQFGVPVTVFPQSFTRNDEVTDCYKKVFVREQASKRYSENYLLAPDMALAMEIPGYFDPPVVETGFFLRRDSESNLSRHPAALVDPILISTTIEEYLSLASMFKNIITDRLHFAIAGLMVGRHVTLLPNSYHKNRSMYETWLSDLGCHWQENVDAFSYERQPVEYKIWKRLAAAPSGVIDWTFIPVPDPGYRKDALIDIEQHLSACASYDQVNLQDAPLLNSLCDGKKSIEDMALLLSSYFPDQLVSAARDLQLALKGSPHIDGYNSVH